MSEQLKADETMAVVLAKYPEAARVLFNHRMHCVGCAIAPYETLAEACAAYDIVLDDLLRELDIGPIDAQR
jgi:hybrid cluster-associated redox disulfide protein